MDIRFRDHASFHRAAAGMVGGSLLIGLALHPITAMAPVAGGLAGIAAGASWGHGHGKLRFAAAAAALATVFVASLASWGAQVGWVSGLPSAIALVVSVSLLALGLAAGGPRGVRGVGLFLWAALTGLVAMWCAMRIVGARETAGLPSWVRDGAGATAMGLVGILAMVPRHLSLASDPVTAAVRRLPATLDPEVKGLCDRAVAIWRGAKEALADEGGQHLVRDGVLTTLAVAMKSAEVKLAGPSEAELAARTAELDGKLATVTDGEARAQYAAARAALDDQRRYRDHIAQGKERLVARMHHHVTALEKFQLAATGLDAARAVAASSPVKQLEDLSQDVTASSDALLELELGEKVTPPGAFG
ncbi:MAG: hypothetical protein KF773_34515 [Deltaproteobacteria bacterium]|nr:hypothetical protein [Deltaproteobacteria bacterium]